MNNIQIFKSEHFGEVRVTEIDNKPMFAASDVAKALGYSRPADAVTAHCKGVAILPTPSTNQFGAVVMQDMKYITESDVYRLVMRSKLPQAEQFQDWLCDDVLPSIRKHGAYATPDTVEKMIENPDFAIQLLQTLKEERMKRIAIEAEREAARPKELFADAVATSDRSCLVAELAKILQQNGVNIGQNRLFDWLRKNGYLCSKGEYYNQPTQRAMEMGLFKVNKTAINKPDGSVLVSCTTKVTGKGQVYFVHKFLTGAA